MTMMMMVMAMAMVRLFSESQGTDVSGSRRVEDGGTSFMDSDEDPGIVLYRCVVGIVCKVSAWYGGTVLDMVVGMLINTVPAIYHCNREQVL